MSNNDKRKLILTLAAAILTTDSPPTDLPAGGAPPASPPGEIPPAPNLAELFTPEEVAAKQEALTAAKAEETRRAALTEQQRAEEDRVKAEAAASTQPPEEYADFAMPEGVALDADLLAEFKPLAKELGLPQAQAQKVADLGAKLVQKTIDGIFSQHQERVGNWLKEAEADPEIGADIKLGKDSAALRAFNTLTKGSEQAKQMVEELGIGNHPEFLRIFYRISQHLREDTFELPGTGAGSGKESTAKALYPNMK